MLDFPNTPATGDLFPDPAVPGIPQWRWDGVKWAATSVEAIADAPSDGNLYARRDGQWVALNIPEVPEDVSILPVGGRLRARTPTELQFIPFNGDWIRIAGEYYPIPPGGIVAGHSGIYVDGVPGQTLITNRVYYAYLFDNNGTLTFDYSQTGHETSSEPGNSGTEIKQGNESRTLIGITFTGGAPNVFQNLQNSRLVRSWLNRPATVMSSGSLAISNYATSPVLGASAAFVSWAGESLLATTTMVFGNDYATPTQNQIFLGHNGAANWSATGTTVQAPGITHSLSFTNAGAMIEGRNTIEGYFQANHGLVGGFQQVNAILVQ